MEVKPSSLTDVLQVRNVKKYLILFCDLLPRVDQLHDVQDVIDGEVREDQLVAIVPTLVIQ